MCFSGENGLLEPGVFITFNLQHWVGCDPLCSASLGPEQLQFCVNRKSILSSCPITDTVYTVGAGECVFVAVVANSIVLRLSADCKA